MDDERLLDSLGKKGHFEFTRSGGPGGQNVNKVSTKVVLRIPLDQLGLTAEEEQRVRRKLSNRLNSEGELVIHSSETRSQALNRERAQRRALALISEALRPPKYRRKTKPSRAAKERRLKQKKRRGEKKRWRRPPEP